MPSCLQEAISAIFIAFTGRYRLTYEDKALEAEDQLSRLLLQLDRREESLRNTIQQCARDALALRAKDRVRCRLKVQEYKRAQAQLDRLTSYKDMVSVHMDALRNTELNKTLISALQESTKTLKGMGIVDGVRQAEAVVSDVEASMAQAQELSQVLNAPMSTSTMSITVSEAELDAELGMLEDDGDLAAEMATIQLNEPPADAAPPPPAAARREPMLQAEV
jgi:hypothetical protein